MKLLLKNTKATKDTDDILNYSTDSVESSDAVIDLDAQNKNVSIATRNI